MKSAIIVLIFTSVRLSTMQNFQDDSASIPPSIISVNENPSCPTQQQREDALRELRYTIVSSLNEIIMLPCEGVVAYLNVSDPTQSCPPAWRDRSANGVRVCGRPAGSFDQCHGTIYSTDGDSYNRVYG